MGLFSIDIPLALVSNPTTPLALGSTCKAKRIECLFPNVGSYKQK